MRGLSLRWVTAAVILIELAAFFLLLGHDGWVYDDNLILILAGHSGFTWGWLTSPIFGHWGIAYHAVFSVLHKLMPLDHRWALAGMLALLGLAAYLLQRIVSMLFGSGWLGVAVASYFAASAIFARPLEWFASGLQELPNASLDLLALYAYLRFQIDGRARWALTCSGALAAGLLFYEKPAYMLLYLALIQVLFLSRDLRPRALAAKFWRARILWIPLGMIVLVWAIVFRHYGGGAGATGGTVTLGEYLRYFKILWLQGLVPAAADITIPAAGLSAVQILAVSALEVVAAGAVVISLARKRSAWRAWLLLVIVVPATGLLVARARIPQFGVGVGVELRYLLDFAWLIPLVVCFAFSSRAVLAPSLDDPRARLRLPPRPPPRLLIGALAFGAYLTAAVLTTAATDRAWAGAEARVWEGRIQRNLRAVLRAQGAPVIADAPSPFSIVSPAFDPDNALSLTVPLYVKGLRFDGVLSGPLFTLDPDGGVHRAEVGHRLGGSSVTDLVRSGQVTIAGAARTSHDLSGPCVTTSDRQATIERRLPPRPPDAHPPFYALVSYVADRPALLPLYVDSGNGYPDVTNRYLRVTGGRGTSLLFVDSPSPRRLLLDVLPDNRLCLKSFEVVDLRQVG